VDDASPDGTQEIANQLAAVYGEDKIVRPLISHARASHLLITQVLKPRSGKLGLGYVFMSFHICHL
jgi:dolichol-phosphate mannosyltransferase